MAAPSDHLALLVIDMQEAFLKAIPESDALVRRCSLAVAAARELGVRTYFSEQVPDKLGPTLPALRELADDGALVLDKNSFSAGRLEDLLEDLRRNEIDHLLIAGIETPICVYQTCLDLLGEDFSLTLLSDASGGRRAEDASFIHATLREAGCHLLPIETVLYSLLQDTDHPAFKAVTALVKTYS